MELVAARTHHRLGTALLGSRTIGNWIRGRVGFDGGRLVDGGPEIVGAWLVLSVLLVVIIVHLLLEGSGLGTNWVSAIVRAAVGSWARDVVLSERLLMVTVVLDGLILA